MNVTAAQFRQDFPEFADASIYTDSQVTLWLGVSLLLVNECRWGDLYNLGIELVTAHHLAIAMRDQTAAAVGGVPGTMTGPLASKSVDKVSASYDTSAATLDNAGFWALTSYGMRFLTLARMMGAGGLQV